MYYASPPLNFSIAVETSSINFFFESRSGAIAQNNFFGLTKSPLKIKARIVSSPLSSTYPFRVFLALYLGSCWSLSRRGWLLEFSWLKDKPVQGHLWWFRMIWRWHPVSSTSYCVYIHLPWHNFWKFGLGP